MDTPQLPEHATQKDIEDYLQKLIDLELMNGQGVLMALEAVLQPIEHKCGELFCCDDPNCKG